MQVTVKKITSSGIFSTTLQNLFYSGWFTFSGFLEHSGTALFPPLLFFFFLVLKYPPLQGEVITFEWYRWRPSFS